MISGGRGRREGRRYTVRRKRRLGGMQRSAKERSVRGIGVTTELIQGTCAEMCDPESLRRERSIVLLSVVI